MISLIIKISLVTSSFVLARFQALSELGVVNRAFEMSFSVGLMVVFLIYMVYENRKKDERQVDVYKTYVDMTVGTIKTIEGFTHSLNSIAESLKTDRKAHTTENEDIAELLKDVSDRVKDIERCIEKDK